MFGSKKFEEKKIKKKVNKKKIGSKSIDYSYIFIQIHFTYFSLLYKN